MIFNKINEAHNKAFYTLVPWHGFLRDVVNIFEHWPQGKPKPYLILDEIPG